MEENAEPRSWTRRQLDDVSARADHQAQDITDRLRSRPRLRLALAAVGVVSFAYVMVGVWAG